MQRTTSVTLGDALNRFAQQMVDEGRYSSVTEVVRAGMRLLERQEQEYRLKSSLQAGLDSGLSDASLDDIIKRLTRAEIPPTDSDIDPLYGCFNQYASPELKAAEKGAWGRAIEEKYRAD